MATLTEPYQNRSEQNPDPPSKWITGNAYRIHLLITCDEGGGYSAVAMNLPGAGSCGDTTEEAVENAKEAVRGILESYEEDGEEIPWKDTASERIPPTAAQKWIVVDV